MKKQMIQQIMTSPGEIIFDKILLPEPAADEVLVKILRIGICGSDIHVYHGKHPYTTYPVTQGHEISGVIEACGSAVRDLTIGDLVTIQPQVVCGECHSCTHGNYHICDDLKVMGFQTTGMASEFFCTDAERVLKLPSSLSPEEGAMIEPLAVACHALSRSGDVNNKKILILGAGPIGNLTGQAAKAMGADSVLMTDISDFRLKIARETGIDHTVNPGKEDLPSEIIRFFGGSRADVLFECVGSTNTIDSAVSIARKGSDIIIVGVFGTKPTVDMGLVQDRELRLIGTAMYQTRDYMKAIELIRKKKINLEPLMTNTFSFRDYDKAYKYLDRQKDKAMKVFIDVTK